MKKETKVIDDTEKARLKALNNERVKRYQKKARQEKRETRTSINISKEVYQVLTDNAKGLGLSLDQYLRKRLGM